MHKESYAIRRCCRGCAQGTPQRRRASARWPPRPMLQAQRSIQRLHSQPHRAGRTREVRGLVLQPALQAGHLAGEALLARARLARLWQAAQLIRQLVAPLPVGGNHGRIRANDESARVQNTLHVYGSLTQGRSHICLRGAAPRDDALTTAGQAKPHCQSGGAGVMASGLHVMNNDAGRDCLV